MDGLTVDGDAVINLSSTTGTTLGQKGGLELFANSGTVGNGGEITWQSGTGSTETWAAISGYLTSNGASGSSGHIVIGTKKLTTDTGLSERIRIASSGDISFYEDTGTTPKFFWDASAESLGIGTAPDAATVLHVQATEPQVLISDASIPLQRFMAFDVGLAADEDTHFITVDQADALAFGEKLNGNDRVIENEWMRITNAGNVGIGTDSPAASLDIRSPNTAVQSRGNLYVTTTSTAAINEGGQISLGGTYTGSGETFFGAIAARKENATVADFNAYLQFSVRNTSGMTEKMRIDSNGNVGIGETNPEFPLDIQADASGNAIQVIGRSSDNIGQITFTSNDKATDYLDLQISSSELRFQGRGVIPMTFRTNSAEAMRIDSSGNVGIGTSSPQAKLDVSGVGNFSTDWNNFSGDGLHIQCSGTGGEGAYTGGISFSRISTDNNSRAAGIAGVEGTDADRVGLAFFIHQSATTSNSLLEAMRIDYSGNVGIGTTSPSAVIHANGSSQGDVYFRGETGATKGLLFSTFNVNATDHAGHNINAVSSVGEISFSTGSTERLRIDSSGNVGIGTASPNISGFTGYTVTSIQGSSGAVLELADSTYVNAIWSADDNLTFDADRTNAGADSYMRFRVDTAEAMRIDSSGNLLVGTTDNNVSSNSGASNSGINIGTAGIKGVISAAAAQPVIYLNLLGTDSSIAVFRKDGTTVGSIGTTAGELTIGSADTALRFTDAADRIDPWSVTSNTAKDNAIDFGTGARRFKDLYLSGGVYLGGTGAANKLDDYEEGTFTPVVQGSTGNPTVTYAEQSGSYTKIGRLVTVVIEVELSAISGGSGFFIISGLPFVPALSYSKGSITLENVTLDTTKFYSLSMRSTATDDLVILESRTGGSILTLDISDLSATSRFRGSITYQTS